jgi:hypothetical protein
MKRLLIQYILFHPPGFQISSTNKHLVFVRNVSGTGMDWDSFIVMLVQRLVAVAVVGLAAAAGDEDKIITRSDVI